MVHLTNDERLALVAQCQSRGWDALAGELLTQPRTGPWDGGTVRQQLLNLAWRRWERVLTDPTADRRPAAAGFKALVRLDPKFDTPKNSDLMRSLALALVPGAAKAGSVEALIDALADKPIQLESWEPAPDDPYWLLVDRGFDAVPALIAALDDDRLTRGRERERYREAKFDPHLRVRHVVSDILEGFATKGLQRGPEVEHDWERGLNRQRGHAVTRAAAEAWLAKARAPGEEAYLVAHVVESEEPRSEHFFHYPVNPLPLRVVATKYPHRLPDVYRAVLARRPAAACEPVAAALARSGVPAREKLALFTAGATHASYAHRWPALVALKELDAKRFDELVLAEVEALPAEPRDKDELAPHSPASVAQLAFLSEDPRVWAALAAAARRAAVELRGRLLFGRTGLLSPWRPRPANRVEFVRLMASFLDDEGVFGDSFHQRHFLSAWAEQIEIRNLAAHELARLFGIDFEVKFDITPAEWAKLRDEVRAAARRELDPPK